MIPLRPAPYSGGSSFLEYVGVSAGSQERGLDVGKIRSIPRPTSLPLPPPVASVASFSAPSGGRGGAASSSSQSSIQRVVQSTPSTFCLKCGATRIDIRLKCCGSGYHSRCIYPWPCTTCPTCRRAVIGIEILPLEPFSRNGELIHVSQKVASQTRGGRWSDAELKYAEAVIDGFMMGVLPIKEGTRLGILLCNLLQCTSARLSSKLKTGKKCFKYTLRPTPGELTKCDRLQRELSEKEELFLYYLSPEDAAAISQRLQMEWRAHFMHVAQRVGQQIDNLDSWSSLLKEHVQMEGLGRSGSFTSENSDLQQQLPGGGTPQQQGQLRGLASMLVRMASDKRNQYAPRHMSGSTTFDDLLEHLSAGPREELALLARAHHGSILFASAGLKVCLDLEDGDILGAWLNRPGGLLHPDDVPLLEQICRQSQVDVRGLMDRMGNPQIGVTDADVTLRTVPLRLRKRDGGYLEHRLTVVCTEDFLLLHAIAPMAQQQAVLMPSPAHRMRKSSSAQALEGGGGAPHPDDSTADMAVDDDDDGATGSGTRRIEAVLPEDMAMLVQDMDGMGEDCMEMHDLDFLDAIHAGAVIPASRGGEVELMASNACGGAYDLYYSPPASFEQTMRDFLRDVPFEAVDIWVPMTDNSGRLWLQFGGGLAMRPDLYDWVYYSRSFCFNDGEGMPGRVFRSQQSEYQDDITVLDRNLFLRRDGAMANGVRTCFGVPVVQGRNVFVLVFYASQAIHMTKEVQDYIRQQIATWRIEATTLTPGHPNSPPLPPLQPPPPISCLSPVTWRSGGETSSSTTITSWSSV